MQKVDFRYSDSDFVAYLLSLGYQFTEIEVTRDRNGKLKAFIHFIEERDLLISLNDEFKRGKAIINPLVYAIQRKKINKIIKSKLLEYQAKRLDKEKC
jgi:hypothetical protein